MRGICRLFEWFWHPLLGLAVMANIAECKLPPICGKSLSPGFRQDLGLRGANREPVEVYDIRDYPFLASIRSYIREEGVEPFLVDDGDFVGTILSDCMVLTSCICVANDVGLVGQNAPGSLRDPELFGVTAGTLSDVPEAGGRSQFRWGRKIEVHPECNVIEGFSRYDVAVLFVSRAFIFTDRVAPIPIVPFKLNSVLRSECLMVGWGWEVYGGGQRHNLIAPSADLTLSTNCTGALESLPPPDQSCLYVTPSVLYRGDVGSPVLCTNRGNHLLVGIRTFEEFDNRTFDTVLFERLDQKETFYWIQRALATPHIHFSGQTMVECQTIFTALQIITLIISMMR